jgi:hypothetical protein
MGTGTTFLEDTIVQNGTGINHAFSAEVNPSGIVGGNTDLVDPRHLPGRTQRADLPQPSPGHPEAGAPTAGACSTTTVGGASFAACRLRRRGASRADGAARYGNAWLNAAVDSPFRT